LFDVNKEEQDIVAMRAELEHILKYNLYSPHHPKQSLALFFHTYKPYHALLRQRQLLPLYFQQSLQQPGSVTLDDYSKKITTFLELAEQIKLDAQYRESNQPREEESSFSSTAVAEESKEQGQEQGKEKKRKSGLSGSSSRGVFFLFFGVFWPYL